MCKKIGKTETETKRLT